MNKEQQLRYLEDLYAKVEEGNAFITSWGSCITHDGNNEVTLTFVDTSMRIPPVSIQPVSPPTQNPATYVYKTHDIFYTGITGTNSSY